ncbi:condensin-2 complex subunit D3-L-like [Argopecten irradians]|uniref:condensin-2 complex subunit D3-L-like n=1 Tax=Argopecten irradians TaxID=31199 RepID=UPI0037182E9F
MAVVERTLEVLGKLELDRLQEDWVKSAWDGYFTDIDPIEADLQNDLHDNDYHKQTLRLLQKTLDDWITSKGRDQEEGFWTVLVENDIQLKNLIALFGYLINIGQPKTAESIKKESAILSCSCYLKLLSLPGSSAFQVFHPVLYEKTVDMLKQWIVLDSSKRKKSATSGGTQKGKKGGDSGGGRNKRKKGRDSTEEYPTADISMNFDDDDETEEMSPQDVAAIKNLLMNLLRDLVFLLETTPLRQSEASLFHTIQILVVLTRHDADAFNGNFTEKCPASRLPAAGLAYKGLELVCLPLHNHVVPMFHELCKCLLQNLLMLIGENKGVAATTIPKPVQVAADQAVSFICHMVKQCGERVYTSLRTLIQHMCTKVPDKTEYRSRVAQSVIKILNVLPNEAYGKMIEWFYRLSKHAKIANRGFTVDIASSLLAIPERNIDENLDEGLADYVKHRSLVGLLLERCSDLAPTVRARAIAAFAQCFASVDNNIRGTLKEIVTPVLGPRPAHAPHLIPTPVMDIRTQQLTAEDSELEGAEKTPDQTAINTRTQLNPKTPFGGVLLTPFNANLPDDEGVMSMLRRRSRDPKVNVRKSALMAMEHIIRFEAPDYSRQNLELLVERCRDPALSARKQAMQSLTSLLLEMPTEKPLQQAWLEGVIPLTIDRESSLQAKCMETLEDMLLYNIVPAQKSQSSAHILAWDLLTIMEQSENVELRRYLQKACIQWNREGKIKPGLITALETHINTDNNQNAWMLMSEIAPAATKINHKFVLKYWQEQSVATQGSDLLNACDKYLSHVILEESCGVEDEDLVARHLFTLGEVVQICPALVSKRISLIIESFIASPCISSLPMSSSQETNSHTGDLMQSKDSETSGTSNAESDGLLATQLTQAQSTQHDNMTRASSQATQILTQFRGSKMSNRIRAFAFIALGKLCLQNPNLAKKCAPALARELETSNDSTIRNNVVIVMCDLCVRYTTTVDCYISNIASCLKDDSPLVRKQTLTTITRLIQEDFMKWKGILFFRYITTLLDECDKISEFAEYCLVHVLLQRHPAMFFHHFLECVFHFNGYQGHGAYNNFRQSDKDKLKFSLAGKKKFSKRQKLYSFMLEHMSDQHRFQLTAKIVQEILEGVVDGIIPLNEDSGTLLQDALTILASKEIKLSSLKAKNSEEDVADEQEMAAIVMATAKKTIITQALKKNVVENIVPVVISLKHILEKQRSPLQRYLLAYLMELVKDFKNEVKEILSADKQLATEIEYDLKKFEEQEQQRAMELQEKNTTVQGTPVGRRPEAAGVTPSRATPGSTPLTPQQASPHPKSPAPAPQTPAPPPRSPNTPRGGSPRHPPTPGTSPAVTSLGSAQTPATNRKNTSLSAIAIRNSARKMLEVYKEHQKSMSESPAKAKKLPVGVLKTPAVATKTPFKGVNKDQEETGSDGRCRRVQIVLERLDDDEEEESSEVLTDARSTPRYVPRKNRAISTPSGVLNNITFHNMEHNMTMIAPSPIPTSLPLRVFSDDTVTPVTPSKERGKGKAAEDVICMFSPDKPLPKQRKWNVHSPAPTESKKTTQPQVFEDSQENITEDSLSSLTKGKTTRTNKNRPTNIRKSGRHKKTR